MGLTQKIRGMLRFQLMATPVDKALGSAIHAPKHKTKQVIYPVARAFHPVQSIKPPLRQRIVLPPPSKGLHMTGGRP